MNDETPRVADLISELEVLQRLAADPDLLRRVLARGIPCGVRKTTGDTTIHVAGHHSDEVERVFKAAVDQDAMQRVQAARTEAELRAARQVGNPWRSGLFYLLTAVLLLAAIALTATVLPMWMLPIAVIGAAVLLAVVGALQLRQDQRLSQQSFLELMRLALRQFRWFRGHRP